MRAVPMSSPDRSFALRCIKGVLERSDVAMAIDEVVGHVAAPAQAFVFGGVLRNAVLAEMLQTSMALRDLDFVVFGVMSDHQLHDAFAAARPGRNRFGGMKLGVNGFTVDIWRAELELTIAGQTPQVTSITDFLDCVTLTADAVLYDPRSATLHERGFLEAMARRTIDLGTRSRWLDPWVAYHFAHMAYVHEVTGFALSETARARVREHASTSVIEQAVRYLQSKDTCANPRATVLSLVNAV